MPVPAPVQKDEVAVQEQLAQLKGEEHTFDPLNAFRAAVNETLVPATHASCCCLVSPIRCGLLQQQ